MRVRLSFGRSSSSLLPPTPQNQLIFFVHRIFLWGALSSRSMDLDKLSARFSSYKNFVNPSRPPFIAPTGPSNARYVPSSS